MIRAFTVCERETRIAIKEGSRTVAYVQMAPDDEELARLFAAAPALFSSLEELTPPMPPADAMCHIGIVPQERCANCQRIARARAALKAAKVSA